MKDLVVEYLMEDPGRMIRYSFILRMYVTLKYVPSVR